jgi:hypothetical protein
MTGPRNGMKPRFHYAPATARQIRQRDRFFTVLARLPARRLIRYLSTRTAAAIKLPEYPDSGSR